MPTKFTFMQISDLHLSASPNRLHWLSYIQRPVRFAAHRSRYGLSNDPSSHKIDLAEATARVIYERRRNIDCVIVSGDLATTGTKKDLRVAKDFIEAPGSKYLTGSDGPTLGPSGLPVLLLPGNHDRYVDEGGDAGGRHFDGAFKGHWGKTHPYVDHHIIERNGSVVAFIQADFCLRSNRDCDSPSYFHKWGQGYVHSDILRDLVDLTTDIRRVHRQACIIWVIHFTPIDACDKFLRLIRYKRLLRAADRAKVNAILCGHLHTTRSFSYGNVKIFSAGSACSVDAGEDNAIQFVDLYADSGRWSIRSRALYWDNIACNFV